MTFLAFPTKESYRKAWERAYTEDTVIPLNVDIELASVCNLRCPFCFYGEAEWNKKMEKPGADGKPLKRLMPTDLALKIIDQAAAIGVPALKFNWRGESTLHRDYSRILQYARYKMMPNPDSLIGGEYNPAFHDILVNTNANCPEASLDGLMATTKCMISLDSTIPETYEKMRVGGDLETALETCKELIRRGHPNLWIRRVITKANRDEPFAERVRKILGPGRYSIAEHYAFDRGDTSHALYQGDYERTYCGYPSQRLMIASDGMCYPCCVDTDGTMPVGNIFEKTIQQIWLDRPLVELREQLRTNRFESPICQKCESWMAYKAPQRERVQDKAVP